jgi:hypothetical protein
LKIRQRAEVQLRSPTGQRVEGIIINALAEISIEYSKIAIAAGNSSGRYSLCIERVGEAGE